MDPYSGYKAVLGTDKETTSLLTEIEASFEGDAGIEPHGTPKGDPSIEPHSTREGGPGIEAHSTLTRV